MKGEMNMSQGCGPIGGMCGSPVGGLCNGGSVLVLFILLIIICRSFWSFGC